MPRERPGEDEAGSWQFGWEILGFQVTIEGIKKDGIRLWVGTVLQFLNFLYCAKICSQKKAERFFMHKAQTEAPLAWAKESYSVGIYVYVYMPSTIAYISFKDIESLTYNHIDYLILRRDVIVWMI